MGDYDWPSSDARIRGYAEGGEVDAEAAKKAQKRIDKNYPKIVKLKKKNKELLERKAEKAERKKAKELNIQAPGYKKFEPDFQMSDVEQVLKAGNIQRKKTKEKNIIYKLRDKKIKRLSPKSGEDMK